MPKIDDYCTESLDGAMGGGVFAIVSVCQYSGDNEKGL